jgi:hypothetical protein
LSRRSSTKGRAAERTPRVRPAIGGPRDRSRAVPSGGPRASDRHVKRRAGSRDPGLPSANGGELKSSGSGEETQKTPPERPLGRGSRSRTLSAPVSRSRSHEPRARSPTAFRRGLGMRLSDVASS